MIRIPIRRQDNCKDGTSPLARWSSDTIASGLGIDLLVGSGLGSALVGEFDVPASPVFAPVVGGPRADCRLPFRTPETAGAAPARTGAGSRGDAGRTRPRSTRVPGSGSPSSCSGSSSPSSSETTDSTLRSCSVDSRHSFADIEPRLFLRNDSASASAFRNGRCTTRSIKSGR